MLTPQQQEFFLARLYTEPELRNAFIQAPEMVLKEAGFAEGDIQWWLGVDAQGMEWVAEGLIVKKRKKRTIRGRKMLQSFRRLLGF